ncbi:MAG: short-chain dehydrogenase [Candidatus Hydrogenedentota bacterium]
MSDRFTNAIVITGATSGIGKACAIRFDQLGFRVFGTYLHESELDAVVSATSDRFTPVYLSLTDHESIHAAARTVQEAVGESGLYGLVNNAGMDMPGPLEFIPIDRVRQQMEVNVIGQVAVTQAFLPQIRKAVGRIVFIGSIDGMCVTPFQGAYGASKHAIEAICDALRMELHPWKIEVICVQPGDIQTPIWDKSLKIAEEIGESVPKEAWELYGSLMTAAKATARKMQKMAKPPETVVRAVEHALTSRRPRTRYLVGLDARMRKAIEILGSRRVDKLIMGFIAKGGK